MINVGKREYIFAALAGLITVAVYLPALRNQFILSWDDAAYVLENAYIRSIDVHLFYQAFLRFNFSNWHPLTLLSHAFDYALWGLNPLGHHLTNILLHALNTSLVVVLIMRLMAAVGMNRRPADRSNPMFSAPATLITAAVTGLLFGLHPVHVETVAWVSERKDLLCAFFYLLSILFYLKYIQTTNRAGSEGFPIISAFTSKYFFVCLIFFLFALMSKPMAVSLPFVLLILDWSIHGTLRLNAIIAKLPFFILAAVSAILTLFAQHAGHTIASFEQIPLSVRILVGFQSLFSYLGNMIWPSALLPFYPYPLQPSIFSVQYILPVAAAAAITAACVMGLKRRNAFAALWGYYVVTLLPVLGIVQAGGQAMADRYTYLPSIGPFFAAGLCGALAFLKLSGAGKRKSLLFSVFLSALVLGLATLSYATVKQVRIWKDGITLWTYAIERLAGSNPGEYLFNLVYHNRGVEHEYSGRLEDAARDYRSAISLNPYFAGSRLALGVVYFKQGYPAEAMNQFEEILRLDPGHPEAHYDVGVVFLEQGHFLEALEELRIAERLKPGDIDIHFNLGKAYLSLDRLEEAGREFQSVIRLRYAVPEAHMLMGDIYARKGEGYEAIREYTTALMLNPALDEARLKLKAISTAPEALREQ